MFSFLRRSWLVLVGTLLVLYGAQQGATILLDPDLSPLQGPKPTLEEDSSRVMQEPTWQQIDVPTMEITVTKEWSFSLFLPSAYSTEGYSSPITSTGFSEALDSPVSALSSAPVPPGPPTHLVIPSIDLDTPVVPAETKSISVSGIEFQQWEAPDTYAAGWHPSSAELGLPGNTVLNGHNNIEGEVFKRLEDLSVGDEILVYSFKGIFGYEITNKMILPEKYEQLDIRMNNAQWILPSQDERLTLVTCWPYESNTHRLIIVARPVFREKIERDLQ